mgnify:FL=1
MNLANKGMSEVLRGAMKSGVSNKPVLDSTEDTGSGLMGADDFTVKDIKLSVAAVIQQWVETDDLDDGETYADRLLALMVGIADENHDGDITDDEQGVLDMALNAAWDYLSSKGASDEDLDVLLNDWDGDVADRVRDLVASVLPEGEDESDSDIDSFAFSAGDQEPAFDAAYKMKMAIRNGKKMRIRKRVSGTVRLSAAQKVGLRKARMKSHSATARMRRAKSMRIRRKSGLK